MVNERDSRSDAILGVRPYRESDRQEALDAGVEKRILDGRDTELTVYEDGPAKGWATWQDADNGSPAILGEVWVPAGARRKDFYRLIALGVRRLVERGRKRGWFIVKNRGVLAMIKRDFTVTVQVTGIDSETGEPNEWQIEVNLPDALAQLQAKI